MWKVVEKKEKAQLPKRRSCRMVERETARTKSGRRVWDLYLPDGRGVLEIITMAGDDADCVYVVDVDGNTVHAEVIARLRQ